jgi:hypothetical protein
MTVIRRHAGIPTVGTPEAKQRALIESVGVLIGDRGDPLDRAVTVRDLVDSGLATARTLNSLASVQPPVIGETPTEVVALSNLLATPAVATIILDWEGTNQRNFNYVEIYRHTSDDLADATLHATTDAEVWSDAVGVESQTYYYWVRGVSSSGAPGPFNQSAGTSATTSTAGSTFIADAAITTAKIALLAVDTGRISDLAVTTAKIANLNVTDIKIGNTIESDNFVTGVSGWQIAKDGDIEMTDGVFRGDIIAASFRTASTGKRIDINYTTANEIEFYGDQGDTTINLLATIGITTDGSDNIVGDFGHLTSGNARLAVRGRSNTAAGGHFESVSGYGLSAETDSGISALLLNIGASTARSHLKMLGGPQSSSTLPTPVQDGEFYFTSDDRLYMTAGTAWRLIGGGSLSQSANGYAMQNYGVIIQWGSASVTADTSQNFSFPLTFPNATRSVMTMWLSGNVTSPIYTSTWSTSQFSIDREDAISGTNTVYFIAVGY